MSEREAEREREVIGTVINHRDDGSGLGDKCECVSIHLLRLCTSDTGRLACCRFLIDDDPGAERQLQGPCLTLSFTVSLLFLVLTFFKRQQ